MTRYRQLQGEVSNITPSFESGYAQAYNAAGEFGQTLAGEAYERGVKIAQKEGADEGAKVEMQYDDKGNVIAPKLLSETGIFGTVHNASYNEMVKETYGLSLGNDISSKLSEYYGEATKTGDWQGYTKQSNEYFRTLKKACFPKHCPMHRRFLIRRSPLALKKSGRIKSSKTRKGMGWNWR